MTVTDDPQRGLAGASYEPPQEQLVRYAQLLVGYALGGGAGIAPGDVVRVTCPENAKPLFAELCRAVWRAGGHVLQDYRPADGGALAIERDYFELASDAQLDFFPAPYYKGLIDACDHAVFVIGSTDPKALAGVPPERLMRHQRSLMPVVEWQQAKEAEDRFSWTVALYGTEAMAAEAGMTLEQYWQQIVAACFLDDSDPIARWREVGAALRAHCGVLNGLPIDRLHVLGDDADLWLTLGERRRWIGGSGRNIPSFEVFTCPDWRGTEGWIRFSEPLYVHGSLIEGVELRFEAGRVVSATAQRGQELLRQMVATDGADRVGEFSLTDARLSRITRFMANTLYDENVGGPFGNTHVALGLGVRHAYDGDPATVTEADWERLGFNQSVVHTDIVSTADRTVTAVLRDGSERVIYAGGRFR